ncbi:hypothetical protein, partial [Stappia sp.]|uniref:hypothetical protein n=1 Tax=Stappia sp. TaxID=1870903 RepID=UPI003A98CFB8
CPIRSSSIWLESLLQEGPLFWGQTTYGGRIIIVGNFVHIEFRQRIQNRFPILQLFEKIIQKVRTFSQKVRH